MLNERTQGYSGKQNGIVYYTLKVSGKQNGIVYYTAMLWNKVEILHAVFCVVLYLDNSNLEFTRCYSEFVSCYYCTRTFEERNFPVNSLQLATFEKLVQHSHN